MNAKGEMAFIDFRRGSSLDACTGYNRLDSSLLSSTSLGRCARLLRLR